MNFFAKTPCRRTLEVNWASKLRVAKIKEALAAIMGIVDAVFGRACVEVGLRVPSRAARRDKDAKGLAVGH